MQTTNNTKRTLMYIVLGVIIVLAFELILHGIISADMAENNPINY